MRDRVLPNALVKADGGDSGVDILAGIGRDMAIGVAAEIINADELA